MPTKPRSRRRASAAKERIPVDAVGKVIWRVTVAVSISHPSYLVLAPNVASATSIALGVAKHEWDNYEIVVEKVERVGVLVGVAGGR